MEAYGYEPSSYKDCVSYVCEREDVKTAQGIRSLVGMRNLIVHRYWTIENKLVYDSIKGYSMKC